MTVLAQHIDLDVPPDFHEVPVEASVEDRVHLQTEILDELAITDPAQREGVGWYLEALSRSATSGAVVSTAFCAVRLGGTPSSATLTVAVHPASSDDPLVFAVAAARALRATGRYDTVTQENLGRTLAAVARGSGPGDAGVALRHLTVAVPLAGHRLAVVLALTTTDTAHLATYESVVRAAAASARVST